MIDCTKTVNGKHIWTWEKLDGQEYEYRMYKIAEKCVYCGLWRGENYKYLVDNDGLLPVERVSEEKRLTGEQ